jgi:putative SOS response-associated peptidase YedK
MCGRYVVTSPLDVLRQRFGFAGEAPDYRPRYNLAPRQTALTVARRRDGRTAVMMAWGLVPSWTKEIAKAVRPINARAETAAGLASFRVPLRASRVLVPATGFFEWRGPKGTKQRSPVLFRRKDGAPFAFAGLADRWQSPDGAPLETFAILTVPPNELVGPVHDRMPAMLRKGDEEAWLDPSTRPEGALSLLAPYPAEEMEGFDVSREVNSPAADRPDLIEPAGTVR